MINTPYGNHNAIPGKPKRRKSREIWTSTETGSRESLAESFRQGREKILKGQGKAMSKKLNSLQTEPMDEEDLEALVEMLVKYGTQGVLEELVRIGRSGRTSPESDLTWEPLADLVESIL